MTLALLQADWPAPARVRTASTTRAGGTSRGAWQGLNLSLGCGDDAADVARNRRQLAQALSIDRPWHWLEQVHGTRVVAAEELRADGYQADALFTRQPNTVCAITTADCVPVLLTARDASVVAAAHAGWRGLSAGVLEQTVAAMGVAPGTLLAWLGPAISAPHYEVGDEVRAAFLADDAGAIVAFTPSRAGHWRADLYRLARRRLNAIGVQGVFGGDRCTYEEPMTFYSHRRDRVSGRMATLIWRSA